VSMLPCQCPCCMSMSMSMVLARVHDACPMSMVYVHVRGVCPCLCFMSMSILHLPTGWLGCNAENWKILPKCHLAGLASCQLPVDI
jgi:hypothetical protein